MNGTDPSPDWTEADKAKLREMWARGHTASEIAAVLRKTRNSVLGRARRMALAGRGSPIIRQVAEPESRPGARVQIGPLKRAEIDVARTRHPVPEALLSKHATCLWIDGDPLVDPTKCGAPALLGRPWCLAHHVRVYQRRQETTAP